MTEGQRDEGLPRFQESRWKRFARWYSRPVVAFSVRTLELIGILAAVFALVIAIVELKEGRELREVTLFAMLLERFEVAREEDSNYAGHVQLLEKAVRIRIDLRNLDASLLRFDVKGGINLSNADLSTIDFGGSNLEKANLTNAILIRTILDEADLFEALLVNADLTQANLKKADLHDADLNGAILVDTNLKGTNLTNVDLKNTEGLRQSRLDAACAEPEEPPKNLPFDAKTKKPLVWRGPPCPE